jgi:hypothetical protein
MSDLPTDWVQRTDPKTGKPYYYNKATKETSWSRPTGVASPNPELPDGWDERTDPRTGRNYFYNKAAKETRWDRPTHSASRPSSSEPPAPQPDHDVIGPAEGEQFQPQPSEPDVSEGAGVAAHGSEAEHQVTAAVHLSSEDASMDDDEPSVDADEEALQRVLSLAGEPMPLLNPMLRLGNDVLLQMLGHNHGTRQQDTATHGAGPRRGSRAALPSMPFSGTTMMVLKRLNEEFRSAALGLRDEYEDVMNAKRASFDESMANVKATHSEQVAAMYRELDARREAAAAAEADHVNIGDPELERAMALLEQRLFGTATGDDGHHAANATQRRLLSFWKAKYRTPRDPLEAAEAALDADRKRIVDLENVATADPTGYSARVSTLRDRANAARTRCEALSEQYTTECRQRGFEPEAPRALSDDQLALLVPAGSLGDRFSEHDGTGTETASTGLGAEFLDYFITDIGHKDQKIRAATAQYYARREEADDMMLECDAGRQQISDNSLRLHSAVNNFADIAGKITSASASFYEEIIDLQSQLIATEEERFAGQLARADENVRHQSEMAVLRHKLAEAKLRYQVRREKHRRLLREKDVDLYRTQRRASRGLPVEFTDFTDAPPVDVKLHLDVLRAKLDVTNSEKQLLLHKLDRVTLAARSTDEELAVALAQDRGLN